MLRSAVEAPDVVVLARRREVLDTFHRYLTDDAFFDQRKAACAKGAEDVWQQLFEENPWLIGSTLAPQFLHSWSPERLEQTVVGHSVAGAGKRPDAFLRTAGAISAVVFAEIKHHNTKLLKKEYRPETWSVADELAGGVAQCHATVDAAQAHLGEQTALKKDGYTQGYAFLCRPRSILVAGTLREFLQKGQEGGALHEAKYRSFERFRRSLRDPEIVTFDELYERASISLALDPSFSDAGKPARDDSPSEVRGEDSEAA
jgi:hypothetical protein